MGQDEPREEYVGVPVYGGCMTVDINDQIPWKSTYLAMIRNSVGSTQYRNLYALVDGTHEDITKKGVLSCAFFVSSLLRTMGLCTFIHATVDGLINDLLGNGWYSRFV